MTNKEFILKITDLDRRKRLEKITSFITRRYELQEREGLTNIIIPAKDQGNKTTIMAHWDLYPGSLGYNDNSSGIIILLKLQEHIPDNVELVFTDGEERGGLGCSLYLKNFLPHPKRAINIDVVGLPGRIFYEQYVKMTDFKIPPTFEYYPNIPFSDSYILEDYGVPNILLVTGKKKDSLIREIFEAEHNGINDNKIEMISEVMMDEVFDSVLGMIK